MPGRVFVAGSANIDLVATVPRLPGPGETVLADALHTLPGGKGANQAVAAARAGSRVAFFGCVGTDAFGDRLAGVLEAAGVDVAHLQRSPTPTGTALISVDAAGQNQIAIFPGANSALRFADGLAAAGHGDVLLCQNECPLDVVLEYFRAARRRQLTTILNAAPVVELPDELLDHVDVLIVNQEEATQYHTMMRRATTPPADIALLARELRVRPEQAVIVTLGEHGVAAVTAERQIRLAAHQVKVVDTTGAGDCFCGYLAACLAAGDALERAILVANAAAALAVQQPGAAGSMPARSQVESFLG